MNLWIYNLERFINKINENFKYRVAIITMVIVIGLLINYVL